MFYSVLLSGYSSFSSTHFASIYLSQWDTTIELLCQVMLLWWLNKSLCDSNKRWGPKPEREKKNPTYSSAHIPPHSVASNVTQIMLYLEHCGGHQGLSWWTHLNCKIGRACWPTIFRFGRDSSVFSHPTRSEATPSPPLISQEKASLPISLKCSWSAAQR